MTAPAVSLPRSASMWAARSLVMRTDPHHLIIAPDHGYLGEVVPSSTTCVLPDVDLQIVATVMVDEGVDAVPVVDASDQLIGIVTFSDLLRAVAAAGISVEEES